PYIDKQTNFLEDYKSKLQELVQTEKRTVEYKLIDESGPAHNKSFTFEVVINGIKYGSGTGASKKIAEQNAAKEALEKLAF
ncbi:MAG: ribonuclease III, partial [Clostridiales bacterium]|nr:ribonuclease III [Clostridiales bacterium]